MCNKFLIQNIKPLFMLHKWLETEAKPHFPTGMKLGIVFTIIFTDY